MKIQIFQSNGINGTPDWHIESADSGWSGSYYIGTHYNPPGKEELIRDAKRKLKQKNEAWALEAAEFEIRAEDVQKTGGWS